MRNPSDLEVTVFVSKAGVRPSARVEIDEEVAVPVSYPTLLTVAVSVEETPAPNPVTFTNPVELTVTAALTEELVTFQE